MQNDITQYQEKFNDVIVATGDYAGEITLEIKAEACHEVLKSLKEVFGFNYLSDITAIDYYSDELRFGVSYNLVSLTNKSRLRVTCRVEEDNPTVDSAIDIWPSANWYEREAWDMMGIRFNNHPDQRRMFMPEDFEYHPLRKEFPLIGIPGSIQVPDPAPPKEYQ
ncbi:UNVERIFIED_CONTAM: hypothetical protein GTU68_003531 [Idotea baltica]|nr:hypothetical protein [Idotea baltica]